MARKRERTRSSESQPEPEQLSEETEAQPVEPEPEAEQSGHYPRGMPALTEAQRPASATHNHAGQELRNVLPDPALNGRTREPPMMPKPWHVDPYNR